MAEDRNLESPEAPKKKKRRPAEGDQARRLRRKKRDGLLKEIRRLSGERRNLPDRTPEESRHRSAGRSSLLSR